MWLRRGACSATRRASFSQTNFSWKREQCGKNEPHFQTQPAQCNQPLNGLDLSNVLLLASYARRGDGVLAAPGPLSNPLLLQWKASSRAIKS